MSELDDEDVTDLLDLFLVAQSSKDTSEERFDRDLLQARLEDRVHAFVSGLVVHEAPC